MPPRKTILPGDRVRQIYPKQLGTVLKRGRDGLGIYVEVKFDYGETYRVHPSQLERVIPDPTPTV